MKKIKLIIENFKKYRFLMSQLIKRDFKVKYKRSVLGIVWSLLYPVLMMVVMSIVFSKMFRFSVPGVNYFVYLETGLVMFQYFSDATNQAMVSVVNNFPLMTKVYIPKYIFPLSKCLFSGINFLLTLIPLAFVILLTGSGETKCILSLWYLFLPLIFFLGLLFTIGIGMILSTVAVFFRDMFYIYGIIMMIWNYVTPIFYDLSIIPTSYQIFFRLNPMYSYINSARQIILFGMAPGKLDLLMMFVYAFLSLSLGLFVFKKNQDKFVYYA